ncbi:MAG: nitroreductase [Polaromonas sp.]
MLSTLDAIRARRSVRSFLPDEVHQDTLRAIFTLAQHAPSNCNTQPWAVHVVSGPACEDLRQRLSQAALDPAAHAPDYAYDGRYDGAYRERQHDAAAQLHGALGIARDDKAGRARSFLQNFGFFGAPHVAFVFLPEPFGLREAADCGMYAQTLMLAMTAHGLASCPQTSLSFHPRIVRQALGLDGAQRLLLGISFGYEDAAAQANTCRVGRAALEQAVRFHR